MKNKLRVVVLMGGKTAEHEISLISGKEVVRNLDGSKYEVLPLVVSRNGQNWQLKPASEFFLPSVKSKVSSKRKRKQLAVEIVGPSVQFSQKPDVVFIAMHGPFGEDGTVQGMLEMAGIPYTGARVLASALGMNKEMFRKIMAFEKIPSPKYLVINPKTSLKKILRTIETPLVVKPSSQGSSVGISIVKKPKELKGAVKKAFCLDQSVIIEEYLKGKEVTCGVLGNDNPVALPVVEIVPKNEFFDYEAKYTPDKCEEIVPARISPKLTKSIQRLAIRVYQAIGCRGFGRVDMIIVKGKPFVLEINTIPGLTPVSLFPKEAQAAGISYSKLLDKLISLALEKT